MSSAPSSSSSVTSSAPSSPTTKPPATDRDLAELADLAARNPRYKQLYISAVQSAANSQKSFASSGAAPYASVYADVLCAGLGAAITDSLFNPLEVVKVRLQTAQQLGQPNESFLGAATALHQRGGLLLLWTPGLTATWFRAFGFTGLRVGLYPTIKALISGSDDPNPSLATKIAAGATTGAIGSSIANPVDLIRTRMQAQAGRTTLYPSSLAVARHVHSQEGGLTALWRGVSATAVRATLLSGSQLATYDELKSRLKASGLATEGSGLHALCGVVSGLVAQTVCQPADTIKSRVLSGGYESVGACVRDTLAKEGLIGLYRGYLPAVCRQAPVVLVQMPLIERIRVAVGLDNI
jgi:solute carrier family 25 uncoupling protein 8/9